MARINSRRIRRPVEDAVDMRPRAPVTIRCKWCGGRCRVAGAHGFDGGGVSLMFVDFECEDCGWQFCVQVDDQGRRTR